MKMVPKREFLVFCGVLSLAGMLGCGSGWQSIVAEKEAQVRKAGQGLGSLSLPARSTNFPSGPLLAVKYGRMADTVAPKWIQYLKGLFQKNSTEYHPLRATSIHCRSRYPPSLKKNELAIRLGT